MEASEVATLPPTPLSGRAQWMVGRGVAREVSGRLDGELGMWNGSGTARVLSRRGERIDRPDGDMFAAAESMGDWIPNGVCTVHSPVGSVPGMKYSLTTTLSGQKGLRSIPVVSSI